MDPNAFSWSDGDRISLRSFNYSDYAWGWKDGDNHLSIMRSKRHKRSFIIHSNMSRKSICLCVEGSSGEKFVGIDEDSSEVVICAYRTSLFPEVVDVLGSSIIVRLATKNKLYLRHCNYILRADESNNSGKWFFEDSEWILERVNTPSIKTYTPSPTSALKRFYPGRPLFIHLQQVFKSENEASLALEALNSFIFHLERISAEKPRVSNIFSSTSNAVSYSLQGAGGMGMEAGACAISMHRPGELVSGQLRDRIEEATTVKSRGGIRSFTLPSKDVEVIIQKLSLVALANMRRLKMFGMHSRRKFKLELGFCEWVVLPNGKEIVPHRDGGNDCDVAAIFVCSNSSNVSVEETEFTLNKGEMYIFEPQKYTHSVSKPHEPGPRIVVALRFFRIYDQ